MKGPYDKDDAADNTGSSLTEVEEAWHDARDDYESTYGLEGRDDWSNHWGIEHDDGQ